MKLFANTSDYTEAFSNSTSQYNNVTGIKQSHSFICLRVLKLLFNKLMRNR